MEKCFSSTAQKLMRSFMQFHRAEWHQRSFEGYKPSEIRVLFCIRKGVTPNNPDMKVSEISKHLHVTSPSVTHWLKGLEAHGLIERTADPSDRRAVGIKLTAKGEQLTQQAMEAFSASMHGLIEYLGEEQSNQLADLLSKATRYYEEKAFITERLSEESQESDIGARNTDTVSVNHARWRGDEEL